ncbi:MAG: nitroreductase family deazaflavin-dependent oxidoreductase [Ornithinimicrobium sp.]
MRSPIVLFRFGLDRVFGSRLVMVEHRGRVSGQLRRVVLEVVDRPDTRTIRVVSGFGRAAQWYRNIVAEPRVLITSGAVRGAPGHAMQLSPQQAQATFARYAAQHPRAWSRLEPMLVAQVADHEELAQVIPVVDLVVDHEATGMVLPPG